MEVPKPSNEDRIEIKVLNSCISAGTEMSNVNITKKSLIERALSQPKEVKTAIEFAKKNGILKTIDRVKGVIDGGKPTGYSIAGVVTYAPSNSTFQKGDRVAAAGAGLANHAEYVSVPENLVMKMPDNLGFEEASTVTLGGIAMQGVRRCELNIGETCVVVGAGILGLIAFQILKASGVRVIVTDIDNSRLDLAKKLGADLCINPTKEDAVKISNQFTGGYGVDAVLFTAATSSSGPLSDSFKMCKRKGRVVLVGVSGMEIDRGDIYKKELDFMISTSYGPGRYDDNYEEKGLDYPFSYVRWTENRNMQEYLRLVAEGKVQIEPLISAKYPIEQVTEAYQSLEDKESKPIIVLLEYANNTEEKPSDSKLIFKSTNVDAKIINVGMIGVGSFATGMHLPNLKSLKDKYHVKAVMSRDGFKAKKIAEQFGVDYATTDYNEILNDKDIDLVIISTRHDSHGELVLKSLQAGKHTFVEKPLCVTEAELEQIENFFKENKQVEKPMLMVGFNRRFSKYAQEIKKHTSKRINPLFITYRMNAGYIPLDHWVHESGGRIVGEACHIIDLMNFFTESSIKTISCESINPNNDKISATDNKSIVLSYEDGSVAVVNYFAVGSKSLSKEYMEVHFDEKSIIMDDYKSLKGFDIKINEITTSTSSKGQYEELEYIYQSIKNGGKLPISIEDILQTTKATLLID